MKTWHDYTIDERKQILDIVYDKEAALQQGLNLSVIEKDWWVTMTLKALFASSVSEYLSFKGGTSLSKGWGVIKRFSEDIDLAIHHSYYNIESTSKSQREKLRKKGRKFVVNELAAELEGIMHGWGLTDCHIQPITEKQDENGVTPIDSDKDPVVLHVLYNSVVAETSEYMLPYVKVEISSLSMKEPTEFRPLCSIIYKHFPDDDADAMVNARTVLPTRTFLEKVFLLAEEFQKAKPRTRRISRHYYDLWQLMQTSFADEALKDKMLYQEIIAHREAYYHVHYINYSKLQPDVISFLPPEDLMPEYRNDYETMKSTYIYGNIPTFDELMKQMTILQERIKNM